MSWIGNKKYRRFQHLAAALLVSFAVMPLWPLSIVTSERSNATYADETRAEKRTMLLRGTEGELPSETGSEATTVTKVLPAKLGGPGLQIELADSFGQRKSAVADWKSFSALRIDVLVPGTQGVDVEFNLFHANTTNFRSRVVVPLSLKPGKNAVRIPIGDLKNTDKSNPDLSNVRRWYISNSGARVTLIVGDVWLEGGASGAVTTAAKYAIKTDPRRLERIRAAGPISVSRAVAYNTPEADKIMSAVEILPPDNPWNTLVEDWPLHLNSKAIIASIGVDKPLRYNADMAFAIVPPNQPKVDVKLTAYSGESDPGPFPVPDLVPIEGWPGSFQQDSNLKSLTLDDVQRGKPTLDADRHGIVLDPVNRKLYEFYRLTKTDNGWTAEQSSVFDLASNRLRPDGWTSSDAAGLPILPSIVRHDELQRGVIDHALRVTVRRSRRAYVYPATHYASRLTDENLPRMGERIRLRKDFDTSKFSREVRVILEALKRYGMFVADNGMDWGLSTTADQRLPVLHEELRRIRGADFEVVTAPPGYVPPK